MSRPSTSSCAGCAVSGIRWCLLGMFLSGISSHSCIFISLAHEPHATLSRDSLPVASMNLDTMSSKASYDGKFMNSLAMSSSAMSLAAFGQYAP